MARWLVASLGVVIQGFGAQAPADAVAPTDRCTIVKSYPHDPGAFTQGLEYLDGYLYEGTGLNGRSSIRKVQLETGKVLQQRAVAPQYFGEGITVWKTALIQLTWQSGVAFVYDRTTFAPRTEFRYRGEGWGLTHDGSSLIMSDGTSELRFLDPDTFAERRRVKVTEAGKPVVSLNELEYVKGDILANVWQSDLIVRIDPKTGKVISRLDLSGLMTVRERVTSNADVLNGIAYDAAHDRLFVTGKLWPKIFEIRVTPRGRS